MAIDRFEDIEAWKMGRELTRQVYAAIAKSPSFAKDWGLKDQITRASGSIMHNIAEGFDAGGDIEFCRFLRYAQRSCSEVQSELYVALDQQYLAADVFGALYDQARQTKAATGGFIKYLVNSNPKTKRPRTRD